MRKTGLISVIALFLGLLSVQAVFAESQNSRPGYQVLESPKPTANPEKIEVIEFFAYTCGHCYNFEMGYLKNWTPPEDVEFIKVPLKFGPGLEHMIRGYYTAVSMGFGKEFNESIFKAFQKKRQRFNSAESVAEFAVQFGVTKEEFLGTYNSFAVEVKVNTGEQLARTYGIHGVPTVIINGKYQTSGALANGFGDAIDKMNMLIEKERGLMNGASESVAEKVDKEKPVEAEKVVKKEK